MVGRTLALVLLTAGCGITAHDGQFTCPDGLCPSGLVCVAGRCRTPGSEPDAGAIDAPPMDAPASDDAPVDVSIDVPPDAGPPETCVPELGTSAALDEDADGAFDEGCTIAYGPQHVVLAPMTAEGIYAGFRLLDDGLTAVYARTSTALSQPVYVSTRPSLVSPFEAPAAIPMTAIPGVAVFGATVDGTGSEILLGGLDGADVGRIYETSGSVAGRTFAAPTIIAELSSVGANQILPSMSRDGLELFFVSTGSATTLTGDVYHARRSVLHGSWGPPELVGPGTFPALSYDGLTLYLGDAAGTTMLLVRREARDVPFDLTDAVTWDPFPGYGTPLAPSDFPRTREIFFAFTANVVGEVASSAPFNGALFRAQTCADGPCPVVDIPCATGLVSDEGFHCYAQPSIPMPTTGTYAVAMSTCAAVGAHLPTVHSATENTRASRAAPTAPWIGLDRGAWTTGEPLLWQVWSGPPATGSECTVATVSAWQVRGCTTSASIVCETEIWPTWVSL